MTWEQLRVGVVQTASGLDPAGNRASLERLTPTGTDLVVFPEAFARDFGAPGESLAAYAEPLDGPFATELGRVATECDTALVAGMFEPSDDPARPYNTLVVRGAGGATPSTSLASTAAAYRKIHLYDSFGHRESDTVSAGPPAPATIEIAGAQIGLMTCYDLRFPELARALAERGAHVLIIAAAWVAGERKVDHWRTLVRARAIENTVYVVAAGQSAPHYCGHSLIVDPLGDIVAEAGDGPQVLTATLTRARLDQARRLNPSLTNRRL